jgi:hypothetical protein
VLCLLALFASTPAEAGRPKQTQTEAKRVPQRYNSNNGGRAQENDTEFLTRINNLDRDLTAQERARQDRILGYSN